MGVVKSGRLSEVGVDLSRGVAVSCAKGPADRPTGVAKSRGHLLLPIVIHSDLADIQRLPPHSVAAELVTVVHAADIVCVPLRRRQHRPQRGRHHRKRIGSQIFVANALVLRGMTAGEKLTRQVR